MPLLRTRGSNVGPGYSSGHAYRHLGVRAASALGDAEARSAVTRPAVAAASHCSESTAVAGRCGSAVRPDIARAVDDHEPRGSAFVLRLGGRAGGRHHHGQHILFRGRGNDRLRRHPVGADGAGRGGYSGPTRESYRTDLRLFTAWLAERKVRLLEVGRTHIELYGRWLDAQGRASSTIGRRLSTLAGFHRYCGQEEILERSPAAHVRRPKQDYESRTLGLDRNELGAFLVAAGLSSNRDHALASLLALNGLRISEALGADIEHLNVERGHRTLRIVRKGGKQVTIPLAPRTARAIDLAVSGVLRGRRRGGRCLARAPHPARHAVSDRRRHGHMTRERRRLLELCVVEERSPRPRDDHR